MLDITTPLGINVQLIELCTAGRADKVLRPIIPEDTMQADNVSRPIMPGDTKPSDTGWNYTHYSTQVGMKFGILENKLPTVFIFQSDGAGFEPAILGMRGLCLNYSATPPDGCRDLKRSC